MSAALGWSALIMGLAGCARSDDRRIDRAPASIMAVRDSEVEVPTDSGRVLAGTYAQPFGTAIRHPAVLLLSGSGPQIRDGARPELPGYLPLCGLADALGRREFGVLRLDDRAVGGSTGSFVGATTRDFARDAAHAMAWLRQRAALVAKDPTTWPADARAVRARSACCRTLHANGAVEVSVLRFPSTNHLFLEDRDGDLRGYARLPSRGLRGDDAHAVAEWLSRRTRR